MDNKMKTVINVAVIISLFICIFVISITELERYQIKKDCGLMEISPDFTPKERQMCRMIRGSVK
jgi:hypothetical protein